MESTIQEADIVLGERVAFGATAEVYQARWKTRHGETEVAAKKIPIRGDADVSEQLKLEVDILKQMNHRNVIKYYGHVVTSTHVIIVTEYAAKGSLKDYLKKKDGLPLKQFLKWAIQAARGIQYLKNLRIVHRDIKSPNFLITADGTLKVCDFGISKHLDVTQSTESDKGTLYWMAPEVYVEGKLSPKADVYSLGIVLWELCTCEVPFKGMIQQHVMFKVSGEQYRPEIPSDCPSQLCQLIQECWQQDRRKRPGIDEVVSRLERFAEVDEGEDVQYDMGNIVADAAPDQPDGPGSTRIKQEGPTPMDTAGVGMSPMDTAGVGMSPMDESRNYPTGDFGVQETEEPAPSFQLVSGLSPPVKSQAVPLSSEQPQSAQEDIWNELADLNMTSMQKRELNQKILYAATEVMCMHLHVDPMLPILKSRDALDDGDVSDIKSQVRTDAKVDRLLEILKRKNDEAYNIFMFALKDADYDLYKEAREIEKRTIREWKANFVRKQTSHAAYRQPEPRAPYRPYEDQTKITDRDFQDVSANLTHDQLQKLYLTLGLRKAAIEKAERKANTMDEDLKALEVLQLWRQMNGKKATREAIIEALKTCQNMEVVAGLEKQWNLAV